MGQIKNIKLHIVTDIKTTHTHVTGLPQVPVGMAEFDTWLTDKLNSLNLDEEVYFDYLKSVLDEEEDDSLAESLGEILSGVLEDGATEFAEEILQVWRKQETATPAKKEAPLELNENIKALIEQQGQQENPKLVNKKKNGDDDLKAKMLAQYGEVSDEEDDDGGSSDDDYSPSDFVNVNAQAVAEKSQQEREKAKKQHEEKKAQDKINLAKDKANKEARKEKAQAKAAKGERRWGR